MALAPISGSHGPSIEDCSGRLKSKMSFARLANHECCHEDRAFAVMSVVPAVIGL
jgi:hypothetical protein